MHKLKRLGGRVACGRAEYRALPRAGTRARAAAESQSGVQDRDRLQHILVRRPTVLPGLPDAGAPLVVVAPVRTPVGLARGRVHGAPAGAARAVRHQRRRHVPVRRRVGPAQRRRALAQAERGRAPRGAGRRAGRELDDRGRRARARHPQQGRALPAECGGARPVLEEHRGRRLRERQRRRHARGSRGVGGGRGRLHGARGRV
mmetsp:Transcript_31076/g.79348  ORF Transcript_31076/g.79348 Transcript_31076/m.79348 type:complete len:203 (-) Transcript_31076:1034-1642(-)